MKGNKNAEARTDRNQLGRSAYRVQPRRRVIPGKQYQPDPAYWRSHFGVAELNRFRQQFDKMAAEADAAGQVVRRDTYRHHVLTISFAIQEKLDRAMETPAARNKRKGITEEISSAEASEILRANK